MFLDTQQPLTDRQQSVLDFVRESLRIGQRPPTVRELAAHLGIVSLNAVRLHLQTLERKGYLILDSGRSRGIRLAQPLAASTVLLPVVGRVAAGAPAPAFEDIEDQVAVDPRLAARFPGAFLLRVQGDSMAPEIMPGDLVVVAPQAPAHPGDIVVAVAEGEATVKRLMHVSGKGAVEDRLVLRAANPAYADLPVTGNTTVNGTVVGLFRRYETRRNMALSAVRM